MCDEYEEVVSKCCLRTGQLLGMCPEVIGLGQDVASVNGSPAADRSARPLPAHSSGSAEGNYCTSKRLLPWAIGQRKKHCHVSSTKMSNQTSGLGGLPMGFAWFWPSLLGRGTRKGCQSRGRWGLGFYSPSSLQEPQNRGCQGL